MCPSGVTCTVVLPSSTAKPSTPAGAGGSTGAANEVSVQMSAVIVAVFALFGGLL